MTSRPPHPPSVSPPPAGARPAGRRWAAALLVGLALLLAPAARAEVPAARLHTLARGVNLTNWFRFPPRTDDAALRGYIDDGELAQLHRAGFSFVRLAVQPELMLDHAGRPEARRLAILVAAIARIERQGLGVMVGWHPQTWHLEQSLAEQQQLQDLWGALAERLRPLDPAMTFPEVMNEPIYDHQEPAWEALQLKVLARIRAALPRATVILTGIHWDAIDGLVQLHPVADDNVVYSFHTYDPPTLTTLGGFDAAFDHLALSRLPYPVRGKDDCRLAEDSTTQRRTIEAIRFYCSEHWDAARLRGLVAQAADWGRRNQVPVIAGEFGASKDLPAATRLAWIGDMRRAFEAEGIIGWALWGYDDSMGFNIHPHGGTPPLDPALLRALGLSGRE